MAAPDGPAVLVIRPEEARPAATHPETAISGRVLDAAFHGRCWRLVLETGGARLRLDWPERVAPGALLTFSLPPERCTILAAQDGAA
ncbi:TOBE domain-containing protein [Thioclava sp. BHET1]|nr:TOBE domain-containing protein [Thioclava sp. BHET1]